MIKQGNLILDLFVLCLLFVSCKTSAFSQSDYQADIMDIGKQGTVIAKVWGIGKNIDLAKDNARKNAVHALLFKGFTSSLNVNSSDLRPILDNDIKNSNQEYFSKFFSDKGGYSKYVQCVNPNCTLEANDRIKIGKQYKVAITVTLYRDLLIKELESSGIKKKFGIN